MKVFGDLQYLLFSNEVVEQISSLNLSKEIKEKLYSFLKRVNHFRVFNHEFLGGENLQTNSLVNALHSFQIVHKSENLLIKIREQDKYIKVVRIHYRTKI
ncbi:hypothetical protein [Rossellomorea aquimaris]|uniref:Uncharacterized protein n=1 Tax=Rossellomorea aquimaris TaxID=189382 RepID=A0A5D4TA94_9BACI|nr:hypothetical protein [Rossellomorea aquimaris]TYS71638.1 hypothetical protein FZC80_21610 [Rossellomorea aquimaris]